MKGLNPFPASPAEFRENLRVETEVLEELYFKPTFYAGDGVPTGGAVASAAATSGATVEFPKAGFPTWRAERVRRKRWQKADVRVTIAYTAIVGSTNTFALVFRINERSAGLPISLVLNTTQILPGPAVANTDMKFTFVVANAITGSSERLTFIEFRDTANAGDTNANSLHVFSVEWEILPV